VTAIMGGGAAGWAVVSQRPMAITLAIGIWFFIAIAWATSIGLTKDVLRPSAVTTSAFLDLSIRRCRRRLRALTAQGLLYVMILTFDLVWIYHYQEETRLMALGPFLTSGRMLVVWAMTAMLAAAAVRYRRKVHRELQNLLDLRKQLGDSERRAISGRP
jgi:hypothetical protein